MQNLKYLVLGLIGTFLLYSVGRFMEPSVKNLIRELMFPPMECR